MPTHFSGQLYQFDSVPVSSGLPLTLPYVYGGYNRGLYFFVGKGGSDGNDGRSWESRKLTIASATTAIRLDQAGSTPPRGPDAVLVIGPGVYDESLTTLPWYTHVIGLGHYEDKAGDYGVNIKSTAPISGTHLVGAVFENITFEATGANQAVEINIMNYCRWINCQFRGIDLSGTTSAFVNKTSALHSKWINCEFSYAQHGLRLGGTPMTGWFTNLVEGCRFQFVTSTGISFVEGNTPAGGSLINNCQIGDGATTLALGVDLNGATLAVSNTCIQATAIDPATASGGKYNNVFLNGALVTQS